MSGTLLDQISEIEKEMARTQKNKATEYHIGRLKAKLAKLRTTLLEGPSKSGSEGVGFDVAKAGHARVALVGFPSVGKSTLLTKLTGTESVVSFGMYIVFGLGIVKSNTFVSTNRSAL